MQSIEFKRGDAGNKSAEDYIDATWNDLYGVKKKDLNRQDIMYSVLNIALELSKISISSLLVIFVPQGCGDAGTCSIKENFEELSDLNIATIAWNFITLATMLVLYAIIYQREKYLIYRLDEDPKVPKTNITTVFSAHPEIKMGVYTHNLRLKWIGIIATVIYIINIALSAAIIFGYFYDGYQSVVQFVVNVGLCVSILFRSLTHAKVSDMVISNTVFIPLVYNQIDKDYQSGSLNATLDIENAL